MIMILFILKVKEQKKNKIIENILYYIIYKGNNDLIINLFKFV